MVQVWYHCTSVSRAFFGVRMPEPTTSLFRIEILSVV